MDAVQMRNLMEHYGKLKAGLDACKGNIRRIKSSTFDEYVEEKTYRSTLGESRLNNSKASNPTEMLGMYGRQQFEQERDFELRCEQRRMAGMQALLWQLNHLMDQLDAKDCSGRSICVLPARSVGRQSRICTTAYPGRINRMLCF